MKGIVFKICYITYLLGVTSNLAAQDLNIDVSTTISANRKYVEFRIENFENAPIFCKYVRQKVEYIDLKDRKIFARRYVRLNNITIQPGEIFHEEEAGKEIVDIFIAENRDAEINDFIDKEEYSCKTEVTCRKDFCFSGNAPTNSYGEKCNYITGSLSIANTALSSLQGLENIISIDGDLFISNNKELRSFSGLENLTSVGGYLSITNTALTSLNALESLTSVGDGLYITHNPALTSLNSLENLTSVDGYLVIKENPVLTSLKGFKSLTSVGEGIYITQNPTLTSLNSLENLTSVAGNLVIMENSVLSSLRGLKSLASVGDGIYITQNPALTSLSSLESLTSVAGNLVIMENSVLSSLRELKSLTSVGGDLYITHNPTLSSLGGLEGLTSIGGDLSIEGNPIYKNQTSCLTRDVNPVLALKLHDYCTDYIRQ